MTSHSTWERARRLKNSQGLYRQPELKWWLFILYVFVSVACIHVCVYVWGTHVTASVHVYEHEHGGGAGGSRDDVSGLPLLLFSLFTEARSLNRTQSSEKLPVRWPVCFRGFLSLPSWRGIRWATTLDQYVREFRGSKLWSSQVAVVLAEPSLQP